MKYIELSILVLLFFSSHNVTGASWYQVEVIVFERLDIKNKNIIEASIKNIDVSSLCSKITNKFGISVSTIEHLMAALYGLSIDNAKIKINSPELPAMDGSSDEYTKR